MYLVVVFFLDSMTCPIINHCMFTYPIMCLYLGSNVIVTISLKCKIIGNLHKGRLPTSYHSQRRANFVRHE